MNLPTGLPHLEGARGRIVGWVFIALTTLAALLAVAGTIFTGIDDFRNIPVDGGYGFQTRTDDRGGSTIWQTSPAARAAGLKDRDRIVAIDGHPVSATTTENEVGALMAQATGDVTLMVRTGDAPSRPVKLSHIQGSIWTAANLRDGMPAWLSATLNFLNTAAASWVLLAAALLLFLRRRHDRGAMAFAIAFSLSAINASATFWLTNYQLPIVLAKTLPIALSVTGNLLFGIAIAAFPDGKFRTLPARIAPYLFLPELGLVWLMVILDINPYNPPAWVNSTQSVVSAFAVIGLLTAIAAQIVRYRRDPLTKIERQQFKWVILSFAVMAIAVIIHQLLYWTGGTLSHDGVQRFVAGLTDLISLIAPPLGLLVSLLRYRLYDAESAISRSVAYGALTLALLAIFAGSEKIIEALGEEYFGHSLGALAGGIGAAIAAVMIVPLHHRVSHWAEHRFQKALLHLRHGLPQVIGDMRETAGVDVVAQTVLERTEKGVRAVHGAIVVDGDLLCVRDVPAKAVTGWLAGWTPADTEHLDCAKGDPVFPMRVPLVADGIGEVGWLLLGPRPDGSFYGKDERETLSEIAAPVARAIAVAEQRNREKSGIETRLSQLEAMVSQLFARDRTLAAE